ncbi:hypothetical protein HII36_23980 [Nonomuraea sp. NN258]|uniref:hypothetical protein n=1 Tax=Nonomuraea antri TaxID=2730852 RepID=UPI001C2BD070|nr:hypothetical protein [Nonomuraea antri]NRQ34867.1 hypothetical protein [Nonomuraea antri]
MSSWLTWCTHQEEMGGAVGPADAERRREKVDHTKVVAKTKLERRLSRRGIPLRAKTLYRMLYETAARAPRSSPSTSKTSTWRTGARR